MLKQLDEHRPAVEAERQLGLYSVLAAASGRMEKYDHQRFVRELRRAAAQHQRPVKATAEDLAALGIKTTHHAPHAPEER